MQSGGGLMFAGLAVAFRHAPSVVFQQSLLKGGLLNE